MRIKRNFCKICWKNKETSIDVEIFIKSKKNVGHLPDLPDLIFQIKMCHSCRLYYSQEILFKKPNFDEFLQKEIFNFLKK